jgi:hypothetical protein
MTPTTPPSPPRTLRCKFWCTTSDGHFEEPPDDRRCESGWTQVPRTLEPMWRDAAGGRHQATVDVRAEAGPEITPRVVLYTYMPVEAEIALTPTEARALARALMRAGRLVG